MIKLDVKDLREFEVRCLRNYKITMNLILEDLKRKGRSVRCMNWSCKTCARLFPKLISKDGLVTSCPCHSYSKHYLIKRVTYILANWPEEK